MAPAAVIAPLEIVPAKTALPTPSIENSSAGVPLVSEIPLISLNAVERPVSSPMVKLDPA